MDRRTSMPCRPVVAGTAGESAGARATQRPARPRIVTATADWPGSAEVDERRPYAPGARRRGRPTGMFSFRGSHSYSLSSAKCRWHRLKLTMPLDWPRVGNAAPPPSPKPRQPPAPPAPSPAGAESAESSLRSRRRSRSRPLLRRDGGTVHPLRREADRVGRARDRRLR